MFVVAVESLFDQHMYLYKYIIICFCSGFRFINSKKNKLFFLRLSVQSFKKQFVFFVVDCFVMVRFRISKTIRSVMVDCFVMDFSEFQKQCFVIFPHFRVWITIFFVMVSFQISKLVFF